MEERLTGTTLGNSIESRTRACCSFLQQPLPEDPKSAPANTDNYLKRCSMAAYSILPNILHRGKYLLCYLYRMFKRTPHDMGAWFSYPRHPSFSLPSAPRKMHDYPLLPTSTILKTRKALRMPVLGVDARTGFALRDMGLLLVWRVHGGGIAS